MRSIPALRWLMTGALIVIIIQCSNPLRSNPEQDDVSLAKALLAEGDSIETMIGSSYRTFWLATENWYGILGLTTLADELTSSWGNAAMKDLSSEPRVAYNNSAGYFYSDHVEIPWNGAYAAIYAATGGLEAIAGGIQIGTDGVDTQRAKAFAYFVRGIAFGYLACMFDQAVILTSTQDLEAAQLAAVYSPYLEVMNQAISDLNQATTISAASIFTTDAGWIGGVLLSNFQLDRLAHAYIARFMPAVARSQAERAAVDWAGVKNHIGQGILDGEDFAPVGDNYVAWYSDARWVAGNSIWTRADYKTIGITDTSTGFQNWLATPVQDRVEFDLYTSDRRITGATHAPDSAGLYFKNVGASLFRVSRGTYHFSLYRTSKWDAYNATESEPMTTLSFVEMRLLLAEAEYRLGYLAASAAIVNETRVANGQLPALTGSETDFFDWLTYEKSIETYATASGLAYFDRRGWLAHTIICQYDSSGQTTGLVTDSPLHFPIPGRDSQFLFTLPYTFGGGGPGSAPKSMAGNRRALGPKY